METQAADAQVSLLSRMNAFYGIPNLSQETTDAVRQGAPAPEVYSPEENQPPQTTAEDANGAATSPAESFFTEATEQVEISSQAMALQQQAQTVNAPAQTDPQTTGETQPETATPANSPISGPVPATGSNNGPSPTSALNAETQVSPLDSNNTATQPASGDNGQHGQANAPIAAAAGNNSNAGQPGALFSALG